MATNVRPATSPSPASSSSFDDLYAQHRASVYGWARRYCGADTAEAEDLTSEVFIKLFRSMPEIDTARVGGWLYRVTANLAISRGRSRRRFVNRLRALFVERPTGSHPVAVLEAREELTEVLEELGGLPSPERVVVCMRLVDRLTQTQIAEAL